MKDSTTTRQLEIPTIASSDSHVSPGTTRIIDLYSAVQETRGRTPDVTDKTVPFVHPITLKNSDNSEVQVQALFDDGAMTGAMALSTFNEIKHELKGWRPSVQALRMANGTLVKSEATWTGTVEVKGAKVTGTFEVFDSTGGWSFLFGKPLLKAFKAVHDYATDEVVITDGTTTTTLRNHFHSTAPPPIDRPRNNATYEVSSMEETRSKPNQEQASKHNEPDNIFTRQTNPHAPMRVEHILRSIKIGDDLTAHEREEVVKLITEFADVFACSLGEVLPIPGAKIDLNITDDITFRTTVHQRPMNAPQKQFMNKWTDQMLEADLIEYADIPRIKHVAPTVLTQKAHGSNEGMTLESLQQALNAQCSEAEIPPPFQQQQAASKLQNRAAETESKGMGAQSEGPKWRVTQNFAELNKATQIPPMFQGDIRAKQQRLSGHKYVSIFDFASGFYAIEIPEKWRPYFTFFVEGRGYLWYKRMAMGWTGAPTIFSATATRCLQEILADDTIELFVDDGGCCDNTFEGMLAKLRRVLTLCRKYRLSLSPTKCRLFMTETTFAGATVGPQGVQPDLTKLAAVVNWKQPDTALNLMSFLGLTGHFRDLIKGYAKIEGPLRDLIKDVEIPKPISKATYRRAMTNYKLADKWERKHTEAFLKLKVALTSQPTLHAPRYDGTPFIVTTDGCQEGFGAVLTQRTKVTAPNGKTVNRTVPIAFASKRTSSAERNYKPFLLEFAALKFGLDHFSDIIWGFPIEIETDCKALKDVLSSDQISSAHARWRDGIIVHNIVAVRHVPGRLNVVADGLSRQWDNTERNDQDDTQWSVNPDPEATSGLVNDIFTLDKLPQEQQKLRERFQNEPLFLEVIDAILNTDANTPIRDRSRARHRATQYLIKDDKLWRVHGGTSIRPRHKTECITREEAQAEAKRLHESGGHWGRDALKITITDKYYSPKLDISIMKAIQDCARCKNFGTPKTNALLEPITRRHPFELLVGDYLSMPTGKGGYHTLGLFLDTFSQHLWVTKHKTAGTAKTTIDSLAMIFNNFTSAETFMTDGGRHFNNQDVKNYCAKWTCNHHVVAAYSPWINGLVEGTNKLLLHVLKRLCAPEVGEDGVTDEGWDKLPRTWPDHLDEAVRALNNRILPALKFTPKELLLGLVVDTKRTELTHSTLEPTNTDAAIHMAYAAQQRLDGYDEAVRHAIKRKTTFDRRVLKRHHAEVMFMQGQLVQIYRSDLDYTFKTERKLLPKWSRPFRVTSRLRNSYRLEKLDGNPLPGEYSARRLRAFMPREGTQLHADQHEYMKKIQDRQHEQGKEGRSEAGAEERIEEVAWDNTQNVTQEEPRWRGPGEAHDNDEDVVIF